MMKKLIASLLALLLTVSPVFAQATIPAPPGTAIGNSTATTRNARPETITLLLDRAFGSTRGSILYRGASAWVLRTPGTSGLPFVSNGPGADPDYQSLTSSGITGAALTKTDDTNVTLTLGGTPSTALLNSVSLTLGWTGLLALSRGGTNANLTASNGGVVYSTATAMAILAGTANGSRPLLSGVSSAPSWGAFSLPGSVTSGGVLYFSSTSAGASSAALTANQIVIGGGAGGAPTTFACATTTTLVHGGTPPTCSGLAYADILAAALATSSEYHAGTASKLVPADQIYQAETTTTFGSTTTFDFNTFINTAVTLTGNITTMTLTNVKAGKAGTITFIQDGTGSRTAVFSTTFKFAGGVIPSLTTTASAIDILTYSCRSATFCIASLMKDVRNP